MTCLRLHSRDSPTLVADIAVALIAFLHLAFLVLEMFFWSKPLGRRVFGLPPGIMASSAPLAANQGLYKGFLAAGLVWGLWVGAEGYTIKVFFLACVAIAGVFGAVTARRSILRIQAVPAAAALVLVWLARP